MKVKSVEGQATCGTRHAREMMNLLETTHTRTLQCELEKLEPHARDKFARVNSCEVSVLFIALDGGDTKRRQTLHPLMFNWSVSVPREHDLIILSPGSENSFWHGCPTSYTHPAWSAVPLTQLSAEFQGWHFLGYVCSHL